MQAVVARHRGAGADVDHALAVHIGFEPHEPGVVAGRGGGGAHLAAVTERARAGHAGHRAPGGGDEIGTADPDPLRGVGLHAAKAVGPLEPEPDGGERLGPLDAHRGHCGGRPGEAVEERQGRRSQQPGAFLGDRLGHEGRGDAELGRRRREGRLVVARDSLGRVGELERAPQHPLTRLVAERRTAKVHPGRRSSHRLDATDADRARQYGPTPPVRADRAAARSVFHDA